MPSLEIEQTWWARDCRAVAGVDEVGRGSWAGPVVAGAVILPPDPSVAAVLQGVRDSKMLTPSERVEAAGLIARHAVAVGVGAASSRAVDADGLLVATAAAMNRALARLPILPAHVLVDGLPMRGLSREHTAIVRGDAHSLSIAAASIVAKVARDRWMGLLDDAYPGYGFGRHKGYGVPMHRAALHHHGPCPVHRLRYAPVAAIAAQSWA